MTDTVDRECITCRHLETVSIKDYPCAECCPTQELPMWEDFEKPSEHWGLRMKEIELDVTAPVRKALTDWIFVQKGWYSKEGLEAWLKQDHTIKNPVRDGQEKASIMYDDIKSDTPGRHLQAVIDKGFKTASEKRMKNFFDMEDDSLLVPTDSHSDLDVVLTQAEIAEAKGAPEIEEGRPGMVANDTFEVDKDWSAMSIAGIKDSGKRSKFNSGAVRDAQDNKGRFDLLPLLTMFRLAMHYERGCLKYGDRNWEKGMPLSRYADSAIRHLFKAVMGFKDEHHFTAALWNLASLIETRDRIEMGLLPKELNDLPTTFEKISYELFEKVLNQLL